MADDKAPKQRNREGKSLVSAYLPKNAFFTLHEVLMQLSRKRGEKVTIQEALTEALTDYCQKHGVELPQE